MAPVARAAAWADSNLSLQRRDGSASQTPFLFFIALGVGIVFTNLWVAIGLKYCCRNRRRRIEERAREHQQNYDDLAYYLNPMFTGVRRRERKILNVEDLNTRFPVMKYNEWGAKREQEGLSAAGGISTGAAEKAQASRLQSTTASISENQPLDEEQQIENDASSLTHLSPELKSDGATQSEIPGGEPADDPDAAHAASDDAPQTQHTEAAPLPAASEIETKPAATHNLPPTPPRSPDIERDICDEPKVTFVEAVEEDDLTEPAGESSGANDARGENDEPGDVCSICLESINPEDNVRGLTCHHVFHDDCITRWLTTRKSSCPLCKRDYYVERHSVDPPEPAHFDPNGSDDDIPRGRIARTYNNFANRLLYSTMYSRSIGVGGPGSHIRVRLG